MLSVDEGEINDDDGQAKQHIPIGMRNDIVEELKKRIFGFDGIHIIHLNDVSCPIQNFIFDAIAVQGKVDKVNDGVSHICNRNGRNDAFHILFDELQLEHQHGNADLEQVREKIKQEGQTENFKIGLGGIDDQRKQRAEPQKIRRLFKCLFLVQTAIGKTIAFSEHRWNGKYSMGESQTTRL